MPKLNLTNDYYTGDHPSLLWEMTICQSLGDGNGTFAKALTNPAAYGTFVANFLLETTSLTPKCGKIIEIGGGYGTLMEALLKVLQPQQINMVDISPSLLEKQQERLQIFPINFKCADIFTWLPTLQDEHIELLILNEIIGDFPTITELSQNNLENAVKSLDSLPDSNKHRSALLQIPDSLSENELLKEAARQITTYNLDINGIAENFNLNYGALLFIEQLAQTKVARTFITEHGCDTTLPYPFSLFQAIQPTADRNPRQIKLKDHDEYNIRFDHLEQIANCLNFKVTRFHLMDLIKIRFDDEINYLLTSQKPINEEQEIFLEFYEHVAEYQGILLEQ